MLKKVAGMLVHMTKPNICRWMCTWVLAAGGFAFLAGCGSNKALSKKPSIETVKVIGVLGEKYYPTANWRQTNPPDLNGRRPVDSILALPVGHTRSWPQNIAGNQRIAVKAGGDFLLSLPKDKDYLLVLYNSKLTEIPPFSGLIAMRLPSSLETLLIFPARHAIAKQINLGTIHGRGDIGYAAIIQISDWAMSLAQLISMADNDDNYLNVKNLINNCNAATGVYYTLRPDFHWNGLAQYSLLNSAVCYPSYYSHYNFNLDTNSTEVTICQVAGTGGQERVPLELYPPAGTSVIAQEPAVTYDSNTPIANNHVEVFQSPDGVSVKDEDFYACFNQNGTTFTYGKALLTDPIPGGAWQYRVSGTARAYFDAGVAAPKNPDGLVNGYIPTAHANLSPNGRIISFNVGWVLYDTSVPGNYSEVTDLSVLADVVEDAGIYLENNHAGTRRYEVIPIDPAVQTIVVPAKEWFFGNSGTADKQVEIFGNFYISGSTGYWFDYPRHIFPAGELQCILPVQSPELNNITNLGSFNPPVHDGIDFKFAYTSALPQGYALHEIVSPINGIVTEVSGNTIAASPTIGTEVSGDTTSGYYAFTVQLKYNDGWRTFLCFEPNNVDLGIVEVQRQNILVKLGQVVSQGEVIGYLVSTPADPNECGPTLHWGVTTTSPMGSKIADVCPRNYCITDQGLRLDAIFKSLGSETPCAQP